MTDRPAILAVGYNRPGALTRLLAALAAGDHPDGVPLVISLDYSGDDATSQVAESFDWKFGPKRVIRHAANLGLRKHILSCGDLTRDYGGVILFEDDVVPAPHFYRFVEQAFATYGGDDRIGGVGLYSYRMNEFNNLDFDPVDDGSDAYFLQVAASWGQAWTAPQWAQFRAWYDDHLDEAFATDQGVPRQLQGWRANSWKRFYIKYLAVTDRYFVFPRVSLSTNMATPGTNTRRPVSIYQVPLDLARRDWHLPSLDQSLARYDTFYEPDPAVLVRMNPALGAPDFDVDLFGTKPAAALQRPRLLSSRPARGGMGFGLRLGGPPVSAIVDPMPGHFFTLAPRAAFGGLRPLSLRRRIALTRASQIGDAVNSLTFQLLKPLQVEFLIRKMQAAEAKAGNPT